MRYQRKLPWLTSMLGVAMALAFVTLGAAPADWTWQRDALTAGQAWRLISGHLVHSDFQHLAWNLAGLAVLGGLVERRLGRIALLAALLSGMLAVDALLWLGQPQLAQYCGLSGVLNALLLPLLASLWRDTRSWLVPGIGVASLLKILLELGGGAALFTHAAWAAVPAAHLAGWLAGMPLAIGLMRAVGSASAEQGRAEARPECQVPAVPPWYRGCT